jgi:PEP-CTERM motif
MKFAYFAASAAIAAIAITGTAHAALTAFVANPTTNSVDWANAVTAAGGVVTTNIDFDGANVGASFTSTAGTSLQTGAGPGQGNTGATPISSGEGLHAPSNFLQFDPPGGGPISLTVNFASAVGAAGLFTIDYFGIASFNNVLRLSAFTGANGTGTLLGSFDGAQFNFQMNRLYFLGVVSTSNDIGSIVFTRVSDASGDILGVDNIVSGTVGGVVPEPASWAMLIAGFGLTGAAMRRRRMVTAA